MARYTGPKCRLCRREGKKLFLKGARCYSPKCPIERRGGVPPGQHGQKRQRRMSDYGLQLREKQQTKRFYGVKERQFRKYFEEASEHTAKTGEKLLQILETRLDNSVFRLGLAPSRSVARQLISHGHVMVNSRVVDVPSYRVSPKEVITFKPAALRLDEVKKALAEKDREIPGWLERKGAAGRVVRFPEREEIDVETDESMIVEFYSR